MAADAASRHPSPNGDVDLLEHGDHMESALISSIKHSTDALSITWDALIQEKHNVILLSSSSSTTLLKGSQMLYPLHTLG